MSLPFFESPLRWKAGTTGKLEVVATVPITVFGVGEATPWEPQPASSDGAKHGGSGDDCWVAHRAGL